MIILENFVTENGDDLPETEPSVPATSYSSSEDEDFYDAEEEAQKTPKNSPE
jgi:hypothetical protein